MHSDPRLPEESPNHEREGRTDCCAYEHIVERRFLTLSCRVEPHGVQYAQLSLDAQLSRYGDVMLQRRRRLAAALVVSTGLVFASCAQEVSLPDDADPELRSGADVFRSKCSSCHGADGGGGIGPSLRQIEDRLDDVAQRDVVVDGVKSMPSFANTLSETDIDAVVRFTREIL